VKENVELKKENSALMKENATFRKQLESTSLIERIFKG